MTLPTPRAWASARELSHAATRKSAPGGLSGATGYRTVGCHEPATATRFEPHAMPCANPPGSMMRATATRFGALWKRVIAVPPSPAASAVHADLVRRLDSPGRVFHNLRHIDDCLCRFDEVARHLDQPDAVEMALWFHDAVYEPGDSTNERRSADLFVAQASGGSHALRARVASLIMATERKRHRARTTRASSTTSTLRDSESGGPRSPAAPRSFAANSRKSPTPITTGDSGNSCHACDGARSSFAPPTSVTATKRRRRPISTGSSPTSHGAATARPDAAAVGQLGTRPYLSSKRTMSSSSM